MASINSERPSPMGFLDETMNNLVNPIVAMWLLTVLVELEWYSHKGELEDILGRKVNDDDRALFYEECLNVYLEKYSHVPFNQNMKQALDKARIRKFVRRLDNPFADKYLK